jgi:hypothetical protein
MLKTLITQRLRRTAVLGGIIGAQVVVVLTLGVASFALNAGTNGLIAAAESVPGTFRPAADLTRGLASGWLILGMWGCSGRWPGSPFRDTTLAVGLGLV